jgi:hypothetical protein
VAGWIECRAAKIAARGPPKAGRINFIKITRRLYELLAYQSAATIAKAKRERHRQSCAMVTVVGNRGLRRSVRGVRLRNP